jgi:histidinol dehydrogenase
LQILNTKYSYFSAKFEELLSRGNMDIDRVSDIVRDIIKEVRSDGDRAIINHISKFDRWEPENSSSLIIDEFEMERAYNRLDENLKKSLHIAYDRIEAFHKKQLPQSWIDTEKNGTILGQRVTPIDKAGIYIPGGKASYPSSLLMNAIPAIVAGVDEIIACVPTPDNEMNDLLLAAGHICKLPAIYRVGGASAIAAMAYGTETIPKVNVITGPGNIFVATAKKLVFGDVQIDMIAGPSEIGVIADSTADPKHIAIDLLSQAEHDEMASSILVTDSAEFAKKVHDEVYRWLENLERKSIALKSIVERGAIIVTENIDEAISVMNRIAPEHLEVVTDNPFELLPKIQNAGAIFLGKNTPEAIGDYIAGPNHTLPTGGSAKFYSPLSTEHFMKKSSIISFSEDAILELGDATETLAYTEGLEAHGLSVKVRKDEIKAKRKREKK